MIRIIGDCHGHIDSYLKVIKDAPFSIQLGDMGIGFYDVNLPTEQSENHKFIRGNHDNPDECRKHPAYLGEFGAFEKEGVKYFFVSGAWSIDYAHRVPGISWWAEEELSHDQLEEATKLYEKTKPDVVLTHDAPISAAKLVVERFSPFYIIGVDGKHKGDYLPQRTNEALEVMWRLHQPKLWIFGHHHNNWNALLELKDGEALLLDEGMRYINKLPDGNATIFVCMAELEHMDLDFENPVEKS